MILDFIQTKAGSAPALTAPIMGGAGTTTVANITSTGAELTGTYTSDGGSPITATGFVVYPSGNPSTIIGGAGVTQFPDATLPSPITATTTGLTPATNYCFKPYATNSVGTSYGTELCFTTLDPIFLIGRNFNLGISKLTYNTNTIMSTLYSGNSILGLCYEGNIGYCSTNNTINKFNISTLSHIASYSGTFQGSDIILYNGYIYSCRGTAGIDKIDANTMMLTSSISLPTNTTNTLVIGGFLYVACAGSLVKINLSTFTIASTLSLGLSGENNIGMSYLGNFLYVCNGEGQKLYKIDLSTFLISSSITVSNYPIYNLIVNNYIYVSCLGSGQLYKIDLSTFSISSILNVGTNTANITYDNNNNLYIGNQGTPSGGNVTKINISTFSIISNANIATGTRKVIIY